MSLVDLHSAAEKLAQLKNPTIEDYEEYFQIAKGLPPLDLGQQFEKEKAANTARYQDAVVQASAMLGLTSNKTPAKRY
jgi:hypothetical protein